MSGTADALPAARRSCRRHTAMLCLLAAGCGAALPAPPSAPAPDACLIGTRSAPTDAAIAVHGAVAGAHAPVPRNDAEQLVFRQLYETLLIIDCEGRVRGALAEQWSVEEDGRVLRFRIRDDAVFSDGARVTVPDVLRSWTANRAAAPGVAQLITRLDGLGERELRVELATAVDPAIFAAPVFAVARNIAGTAWPAGTTGYVVEGEAARTLRLVAAHYVLDVDVSASGDVRRALDTGVDALLTTDAAALAYARALPGYDVVPIGWARTSIVATRAAAAAPPADAVHTLARDVVRGDARGVEATSPCATGGAADGAAAPGRLSRSVLYAADDAAGRALAERIVALAWPAERAPAWVRALLPDGYARSGAPVAAPVQPAALADALRQGAGLAWVLSVPRVTGDVCVDVLLDAAAPSAAAAARRLMLVPLVETRAHAVLRTGAITAVSHGDGVVRFAPRP